LLAASAGEGATPLRFRALVIGGALASWHGDYGRQLELSQEAVAMAEATGDLHQLAVANAGVGWALIGSQPTSARDRLEDAVALARELGDTFILWGASRA
jgi:hypothetical protein